MFQKTFSIVCRWVLLFKQSFAGYRLEYAETKDKISGSIAIAKVKRRKIKQKLVELTQYCRFTSIEVFFEDFPKDEKDIQEKTKKLICGSSVREYLQDNIWDKLWAMVYCNMHTPKLLRLSAMWSKKINKINQDYSIPRS